jgi:uncharacterized membrane protein
MRSLAHYTVLDAVFGSGSLLLDGQAGWGLVALPIGGALLLFSACWPLARRWTVRRLPEVLRSRVPEAV